MVTKTSPSKTQINGKQKAPDGGWGWVVVFGSFMISVIGDGFSYTIGLFYVEFLNYYKQSETITSIVPGLMTGMIYCAGPFAGGLTNTYGCRKIAIVGTILTVTGMVSSIIFSASIYYHWITLGFITGTGLGLLYLPQIIIVTYWFDRHLSLATGIAVCGSGIGMAMFAVLSDQLIDTYGWKGAMLMLSGIMFTCIAYSALFRKVDHIEEKGDLKTAIKEIINFNLMRDIVFDYYMFANFINSLVYYVPIIFIKDRAMKLGIADDRDAARLIVYLGLANAFGRAVFGFIAEIESLNRLILFSCSVLVCGIATALSTFAYNYQLMVVYVVIFGLAEGSYVCLCTVTIVDLFGVENVTHAFGILSLFEGFASMIGPPLIGLTVDKKTKSYETGIWVCGIITIISGILLLFIPLLRKKYKSTINYSLTNVSDNK